MDNFNEKTPNENKNSKENTEIRNIDPSIVPDEDSNVIDFDKLHDLIGHSEATEEDDEDDSPEMTIDDFQKTILERVKLEAHFLDKAANEKYESPSRQKDMVHFATQEMVFLATNVLEETVEFVKNHPDMDKTPAYVDAIVSSTLNMLMDVISGGCISPITGDDEEWEDIEFAGNEVEFTFRDITEKIPVDSVQVNLRCKDIFRFNRDNRYAHRVNMIQIHDVNDPDHVSRDAVKLLPGSVRFIQFPYNSEIIGAYGSFNPDGTIKELVNSEVFDQSVYINEHGMIVAPGLPVHICEAHGIDLKQETHEALELIKRLMAKGEDADPSDSAPKDDE